MKKLLPAYLRGLLFSAILLFTHLSSYATHIVGAELRYKWVSGNTYTITMYLYGDCGPSSLGSFQTLPITTPHICIYDGNTSVGSLYLSTAMPSCGTEITPVCPDSLSFTDCTSLTYSIPGVKKFVYSANYTLPHTSATWRFVYTGYNGGTFASWSCPGSTLGTGSASPAIAGRSASITSISSTPDTYIQLIDTLNNSATNTRGNNSNPILTVEPTPYFCEGHLDCYNPGAIDIYDVGPGEPSGDSLVFSLVDATSGDGTPACAVGGSVTYLFGLTGTNPLQLSSGSLAFDANTGQMCFTPILQRSVVVYNIDEYRNDTISATPLIVNKVMVGNMQREMTFLVLPCITTTPVGGIDSAGGGSLNLIDSFHSYSCANSGVFSVRTSPRESDTSLHIDITATGLSAGFTFSVINNGTSTPEAYIYGNTALIAPGHYIIYLTYTDNHCPLVGTETYPFTFDILPVPTITEATITQATCSDSAVVKFTPGGTGKPWTIKLSHNPAGPPATDSFKVFTMDTAAFTTNLAPGHYYMTIFTSVSNDCNVGDTFSVAVPSFSITATYTSPTYCGARDGTIIIAGLNPGFADTLGYNYQGIAQPRIPIAPSPTGTDTMTGLLAGVYSNIIVQQNFCFTDPAIPNPLTLVNPPFIWRTVTTQNATKCGFCNGSDTLFGLHPSQLDTITYTYTPATPPGGSLTTPSVSRTIGADSMVVMTGLCPGSYTSFVVKTAGVCSFALPGAFTVDQPHIKANFADAIHYGCSGDTVFFTNHSYPNVADMNDSVLTYKWAFGDGTTTVVADPEHLYSPTNNTTFTARLYITNSVCVDSDSVVINLNNYVAPGFTFLPQPYVCQGTPVTFTNTSTGTNLTYLWEYGDGTTDITPNPTHAFTTTGKYTIKLVASDHVLPTPQFFTPCYDTAYGTISVDSISVASIVTQDTVICKGEAIDFNGIYSHLGDTLVAWTFGDGNGTDNVNPILHSFDGTGTFTVKLDIKYRACPETITSRSILAFGIPSIYLGPDTAMCPGSNAIVLSDNQNAAIPGASWKWSTGETTPSIVVTKPGTYYTVVTIDGCTASDTVIVNKDCYVDIPNVFTPNGDGVNDYFFPRQMLTRGVVQFKMDVYNRWGQNVYETESTDGRGWDGSLNNKPQPEGVYVYIIDVTFKDGQIEHHQGNITLLR